MSDSKRNYMFTHHRRVGLSNEEWEKECEAAKLVVTIDCARFLCFQEEKCPNPGQGRSGEHLQGYIQMHAKMTMKSLYTEFRKVFNMNGSFQESFGTPTQAAHYCLKNAKCKNDDGTPCQEKGCIKERIKGTCTGRFRFKEGDFCKGSGARSDVTEMMELVKQGKSDFAISEQYPAQYMQYFRSISNYRKLYADQFERRSPTIVVLWGGTNTRKSTRVRGSVEHKIKGWSTKKQLYTVSGDDQKGTWFDGYNPMTHEDVLFDDFRGQQLPYTKLLQMLEEGDYQVPVKGGFATWMPKRVFFTSNVSPDQWYAFDQKQQDVSALLSRLPNVFQVSTADQVIPGPDTWKRGRKVDSN